MAGFDYLDVPRRSFQRIGFRLTDSYGKDVYLKNSHCSMSIIFRRRGEIIIILIYSNKNK